MKSLLWKAEGERMVKTQAQPKNMGVSDRQETEAPAVCGGTRTPKQRHREAQVEVAAFCPHLSL